MCTEVTRIGRRKMNLPTNTRCVCLAHKFIRIISFVLLFVAGHIWCESACVCIFLFRCALNIILISSIFVPLHLEFQLLIYRFDRLLGNYFAHWPLDFSDAWPFQRQINQYQSANTLKEIFPIFLSYDSCDWVVLTERTSKYPTMQYVAWLKSFRS